MFNADFKMRTTEEIAKKEKKLKTRNGKTWNWQTRTKCLGTE